MRTATRFSIGVHILTLLGFEGGQTATSEWIGGSIGVNPVVVRNITGMLRRAGLAETHQGTPGVRLAKPLSTITLLDVYRAVEDEGSVFAMHGNPNPDCPVGAHIEAALGREFDAAQKALEERLASTTLESIVESVRSLSAC